MLRSQPYALRPGRKGVLLPYRHRPQAGRWFHELSPDIPRRRDPRREPSSGVPHDGDGAADLGAGYVTTDYPTIRVVIIEDHPVTRLGLAQVVARAPGLELVTVASSIEEYEGRSWPDVDVILLDLGLGDVGLEGPAAVRHLRGTGVAVLVVSMYAEEMPVLDAISAGAHGYLTKETEPDEIARAVRAVAKGGTYFSATVAGYLLRTPTRLTEREAEILRLVAGGETAGDIARQLFITEKTVNGHLERIRDKTGYRRRADLTRLAYERGIFPRRWRKKG